METPKILARISGRKTNGANTPSVETGAAGLDPVFATSHGHPPDQARQLVNDLQHRTLELVGEAVAGDHRGLADAHYDHLWKLRDLEAAMGPALALTMARKPVYHLTPFFLRRCLAYLTADDMEAMCYVSGVAEEGDYFLSDIVEFEMAERSTVGVHGSSESLAQAVLKLSASGQFILGWLHSHPGAGPGATHPSGTDISMQKRMEKVGYPAIGGIFTRDGYVRFFADQREFSVKISGKGVTHVESEEWVYQIYDLD